MKKLVKNLTFWVLLAIAVGIILGHVRPDWGVQMKPLGETFISIVKLFIIPIIFVTIVLGISGMESMKRVGRVGGLALLYFEVVTTLALVIGIVVAMLIHPGTGIDTHGIDPESVSKYKSGASISWIGFFKDNSTIQVLLISILVGLILNQSKRKKMVLDKVQWFSHYLFQALRLLMILSPIGAFGGMAYTIGKFGIAALFPLGKLMLCVYITMFLFVAVILGSILRSYKINIWRFLAFIKEELLIVLGTSSSEAALPSLMKKMELFGCHQSVVGLVVPTGYSFNLDGTSIYLSMAIIFLAQVFDVQLSWEQILTIIGVLMVTSKGAAGVTGSGFVILASTLSAVKVIPVEGLALLLGVDRFMSEARAITNCIGNGVATVFISNYEKMFDTQKMNQALAAKKA